MAAESCVETVREIAEELNFSHTAVVNVVKHVGKVKKLNKLVLHD